MTTIQVTHHIGWEELVAAAGLLWENVFTTPLNLTKADVERSLREILKDNGEERLAYWHEHVDDEHVDEIGRWARAQILRLWPEMFEKRSE